MTEDARDGWSSVAAAPPVKSAGWRREPKELKAWWSAQRRRYNIALVIAAPISAVSLLTIWGFFEERLPCLEITGFSIIFGGILFLLGLGLANICYLLGPLSERIVRPRNAFVFRRWAYGIGLAFSLLLIFSPPLLNLIVALLGPLPCTDKFGHAHAFNSGSLRTYPTVATN
jgi:hypothetical protein